MNYVALKEANLTQRLQGVASASKGDHVCRLTWGDCCPHRGESTLWAHSIEGVSNYHVQAGVRLGKAGVWPKLMAVVG